VKQGKCISRATVFGIGWRLVKCLQTLHQVGWLHLDVNPANVMIADNLERGVVLVDFGLSLPIRVTKVCPRSAVNGNDAFVGRHVRNLERESARDDLEAVGLTMAWMLLGGTLPWIDYNFEDMKEAIGAPDLPQTLGKQCKSRVLEQYLDAVRRLGVDEEPKYEELLELLEKEAELCVDKLDWSSHGETMRRKAPSPRKRSASSELGQPKPAKRRSSPRVVLEKSLSSTYSATIKAS